MNALDRPWARAVSFVATLALIMWGLSAGFVHGVGFVPRNAALRLALGPLAAWPLMALGLFFFVRHFS